MLLIRYLLLYNLLIAPLDPHMLIILKLIIRQQPMQPQLHLLLHQLPKKPQIRILRQRALQLILIINGIGDIHLLIRLDVLFVNELVLAISERTSMKSLTHL